MTLVLAAGCIALVAGCGSEELNTIYGRRQGPGASSINGTAVLGDMFAQAGLKVTSWQHLTPRLKSTADCIVWFPDDKEPPSEEVREWLDRWLDEVAGRTLVYVLRDYDAAPAYWEKAARLAPETEQKVIGWQREFAQVRAEDACLPRNETLDFAWFRLGTGPDLRRVHVLSGEPEWTAGVNAAHAEIVVGADIRRRRFARVLLRDDVDPLIVHIDRHKGRILAVANGSFLLNLPLLNHEHRKLAGKLIDDVRASGAKQVAFLESRPGGPPVHDKDPKQSIPTGLAIFLMWPSNWILWHFAVAGVLYCAACWPIFGVPRRPAPEALSDFGRHVQALAEHLEKTRDRNFARSRVQHWRQLNPDGSCGTAGLSSSAGTPRSATLLDKPAVPHMGHKAGVES